MSAPQESRPPRTGSPPARRPASFPAAPPYPLDDDSEGNAPAEIPELAPGAGKFYWGRIVKLNRNNERGVIRSSTGRNIPFAFLHVTMVGSRRTFADLREHMQVGFDVSQTARGLRVSLIRIPE